MTMEETECPSCGYENPPSEHTRCHLCGEEHHDPHDVHMKRCEGPPLTVLCEKPLMVVVGMHGVENIQLPYPQQIPAMFVGHVLAECLQRLHKEYPGLRFQLVPYRSIWLGARETRHAKVTTGESLVTTMLAIEQVE